MHFETVQDFLSYFKTELDSNHLVLPTLPEVALKIRDTVSQGDATSQKVAEIIATDTALSARLIQVVNSPLYRGTKKINNIQMAATRLGNKTIRSLVSSMVMQQIFTPTTELLDHHFREIWEQSTQIAAISRALSVFIPHLDADEAMLAGLIHQIGKLPILTLTENIPDYRDSPTKLEKLLEAAHPAIGKMIVDTWDFPKELKSVPSEYVNFERDSNSEADYVDIVQVAFLQNIEGTDHPASRIEWNTVPAFSKLGMTPDADILEIEGVAEDIETAQEILIS